jgi:hypothetical protein
MSRRIEARSVKSKVNQPCPSTDSDKAFLEAFTLGKTQEQRTSEPLLTCSSPVCDVQFHQTGMMRMEPRRFCCPECRMDAWVIKRASKLLEGLADERVIQILRANR